MSSVTLAVTRPATPAISVPFCDERWPRLKVLGAVISNLFFTTIYRLTSYLTWAFSRKNYHHFRQLADYHEKLLWTRLLVSVKHWGQIIDFSLNSSMRMKELTPASEYEALKEMYGEKVVASWFADVPKDKLTRLEMANDRACMGMSIDFIAQYFKELRSGKTPLEAIKTIAPRYAQGAPDEAVLMQIFYKATHRKTWVNPDTSKEFEKWISDREYEIFKISEPEKRQKEQDKFYAEFREKIEKEKQRLTQKLGLYLKDKYGPVVQKRGLLIQEVVPFVAESEGIPKEWLLNQLQSLKEGSYLTALSSSAHQSGQAMVLIKTKDSYFISDPSYATLALSLNQACELLSKRTADALAFSLITESR